MADITREKYLALARTIRSHARSIFSRVPTNTETYMVMAADAIESLVAELSSPAVAKVNRPTEAIKKVIHHAMAQVQDYDKSDCRDHGFTQASLVKAESWIYSALEKAPPAVATHAEPVAYRVGNWYATKSGNLAQVLSHTGEVMRGSDGIHRYDRDGDRGRVTGSPHDFSHPENFVQLFTAPPVDTQSQEKDAERYRWLRSDDIGVKDGQNEICVVKFRLPHSDDSDVILVESELDEAIDAAIADLTSAEPAVAPKQ